MGQAQVKHVPKVKCQSTMQGTDIPYKAVWMVLSLVLMPRPEGELSPDPCTVAPPPRTSPSTAEMPSHAL